MSTATTEKPKRTRAPRRNFEKELTRLTDYCRIKVEVLESMNDKDPRFNDFIEAYKDVLAKISGQAWGK